MGKSQITTLPLNEADRREFVDTANKVFEVVLRRLDLDDPDAVRKLWNAAEYVDNSLLSEDMLPISRDYALSLIDAFLVHYVLDLLKQAESRLGPVST